VTPQMDFCPIFQWDNEGHAGGWQIVVHRQMPKPQPG
jgi:hypothetical protein